MYNFNSPQFEALEERLLLSASPIDNQEIAISAPAIQQDTSQVQVQVTEVLVIDTSVDNYEDLIASLDKPNLEIHFIDSNSDGVLQLSNILSAYKNLDALHIVSHGAAGQVNLGNSELSAESLDFDKSLIQGWSQSFSDSADILIYGCNVADGVHGQAFVDELAELTQTDVAASDDITGAKSFNGDAQFEYTQGLIEAEQLFSQEDYETAKVQLAFGSTHVVTSNADSGEGSLRDLIATANAGDTIVFTQDMTVQLESFLFVDKDITIDAGGHNVTLDGQDKTQIFYSSGDVASPYEVTLNGLNLTNASSVETSLDLDGRTYATSGGFGGAIFAQNTNLTLNEVSISNSKATTRGGAIYHQGGTVNINNSSFTNNNVSRHTASNSLVYGGAVYSESEDSITIQNSTFTANSAYAYSTAGHTLAHGGAVYLSPSGSTSTVSLFGNSILSNSIYANSTWLDAGATAQSYGAGLSIENDSEDLSLEIKQNTFANNSLESVSHEFVNNSLTGGAGFSLIDKSAKVHSATVSYNTFSANSNTTHFDYGSAIYAKGATPSSLTNFSHNTVAKNSTNNLSGTTSLVVFAEGLATYQFDANLIAGNTTNTTLASLRFSTSNYSGSSNIFQNFLVQGNTGVSPNGFYQQRSASDIALEDLADNGGLTQTHALAVGSVAVGAAGASSTGDVDQRGYTITGTKDVGAFELGASAPAASTETTYQAYSADEDPATPITVTIDSAVDLTVSSLPALSVGTFLTNANDPSSVVSLNDSLTSVGGTVTLYFVPALDWNGSSSIQLTAANRVANIDFFIFPVNDAPRSTDKTVEVNEDATLSFSETDFAFSDDDHSELETVIITALPTNGTLFDNGLAIILTDGKYVLPKAALATLTYQSAADNDTDTSFTFKVSAGSVESSEYTMSITVYSVTDIVDDLGFTTNKNTPKEITFDQLLANDLFEGNNKTITAISQPVAGGTTVLDSVNNKITFTPANDQLGVYEFTYTAKTDSGIAETATVRVTVGNTTPVANDDSNSINEPVDGASVTDVTGNVISENDTDADLNDTLTVKEVTGTETKSITTDGIIIQGSYGVLTIDQDGSYSYAVSDTLTKTITADVTDSFSYTITDEEGLTATSELEITIKAQNDTPSSANNSKIVNEDEVLSFSSTDFIFSDDDHTDLDSVIITVLPSNGTLFDNGVAITLTAGQYVLSKAALATLTYQSAADNHTDTSFSFKVSDGSTESTTYTMSITVDTVTDIADDLSFIGEKNTPKEITFDQLLVNDLFEGNNKTITAVTNPVAGGTAVLDSVNNKITFTPANDQLGVYEFTYTAKTDSGIAETAKVRITVGNTTPVANDDSNSINEPVDGAAVTDVTGNVITENDTDADLNDTLTVKEVTGAETKSITTDGITIQGSYGVLTIDQDGSYSYAVSDTLTKTITADVTDTFSYTITDEEGLTATAELKITITAQNDTPSSANNSKTVNEDEILSFSSTDFSFSDDDHTDLDSVIITALPSNGTLFDNGVAITLTADKYALSKAALATLTYQSSADNHVDTSFNFKVSDGSTESVTYTMSITVNAVNDPADLGSDSKELLETDSVLTTGGTLSITDVDAGEAFFSAETINKTYGSLTIQSDGQWNYTASAVHNELTAGQEVEETFTVSSVDGTTSTIIIKIVGTNDTAILGSDSKELLETDSVLTTGGTLSISDADAGEELFTDETIDKTYGSLTIQSDGQWNYVASSAHDSLTAGQEVEETFTVSSVDGTTSTIVIKIVGTNDAAILGSDSKTLLEANSALSTSGTLSITDADAGEAFFNAETIDQTYGSLTIESNGQWNYVANSAYDNLRVGQELEETFTVSSIEGTTSTIVIKIVGTNDTAILGSDSKTLLETDSVLTTSGTLSITDADTGEALFNVETIDQTYGSLTIQSDGQWNYTASAVHNELTAGQEVEETFTVSSVDGTTSTIVIKIVGTNDTALLGSDSKELIETDSTLTTGGTLSISDIDADEALFTAETLTQNYGSLTIQSDGQWTFASTALVETLSAGQEVEETFTVRSVDGTTSTVVIKIVGTNDTAILSSDSRTLNETNALLTTSGQLSVTDADAGEAFFNAETIDKTYGSVTIAVDGTWTYTSSSAHNALIAGEEVEETFVVSSIEGTSSTITVKIVGTNDTALISGDLTATLPEGLDSLSGQLTVTDLDSSEASFKTTVTSDSENLGSLVITADGQWIYTVDASAVEALATSQLVADSFAVETIDGTKATITVTLKDSVNFILPPQLDVFESSQDILSESSSIEPIAIQQLSAFVEPNLLNFLTESTSLNFDNALSEDMLQSVRTVLNLNPSLDTEVAANNEGVQYKESFYDNPVLTPSDIQFIESLLKAVEQFEEVQEEEGDELSFEDRKFSFFEELAAEIQLETQVESVTMDQLDERKSLNETLNEDFSLFA